MRTDKQTPTTRKVSRRPRWERPRLTSLGDLEKIVFGGGGKVSGGNDPGDTRKPRGLG